MTTFTLDVSVETIERFGGEEKFKRLVLESLILLAVRDGFLPTSEVRRHLGFKTHKESRDFLAAHGVYKEVPTDEFSADLDMIDTRLKAEG